jgi:hypothetical protein
LIPNAGITPEPTPRRLGLTERQRFCKVIFQDVAGGDVAAFGDQPSRKRAADAGATAGDDGKLAAELSHRLSPQDQGSDRVTEVVP